MLPGPPPFFSHYLFEDPRLLMGALGVTAVMLLLLARQCASRRLLIAGVVALALVGGEYLLARMVVTVRERLTERTTELVRMTDPMDMPALQQILLPSMQVTNPNGDVWFNHQALVEQLRTLADRGVVRKQDIESIATDLDATGHGRALLKLRTTVNVMGFENVVPSEWLITWSQGDAAQWQVSEIRCLRAAGISTSGPLPTPGF